MSGALDEIRAAMTAAVQSRAHVEALARALRAGGVADLGTLDGGLTDSSAQPSGASKGRALGVLGGRREGRRRGGKTPR